MGELWPLVMRFDHAFSEKSHRHKLDSLTLKDLRGQAANNGVARCPSCCSLCAARFTSRKHRKRRSIPLHTIPIHSTPFQFLLFHPIPFHFIPFNSNQFHSTPLHSIPYHSIQCHSIPVCEVDMVVHVVQTLHSQHVHVAGFDGTHVNASMVFQFRAIAIIGLCCVQV